jgi:8-oxo-dGTP pyrophosphatase MutT (NUDIX family)
MTLLRHVEACNRFDPADYRDFAISGHAIGRLGHAAAEFLLAGKLVGALPSGVGIPGGGFKALSARLDGITGALSKAGLMPPLRGEMTPVLRKWGGGPCAEIDRAGLPGLGVPAFGVHVNGYVRANDGLYLWVGHRARDRQVAPGKLDHLVAGGIPMGYTAQETVVKEAGEEAGLPAEIAQLAKPVSIVSYQLAMDGFRNDTLFVYDLEVPRGVVPVSIDGEVERFELLPVQRVMDIIRDTDDFKFNVNLVLIDFLIRHAILDPDNEPDYAALVKGLRR